MSAGLYETECQRAESMDRDAILSDLEQIAEDIGHVPSLGAIHVRMVRVEALTDTYRGHDTWDQVYLLEALMRCHERFRDWIGAYS